MPQVTTIDQPSTPTENRETVTSGQISDVPENNNANGDSPQGSVTDAANFEKEVEPKEKKK